MPGANRSPLLCVGDSILNPPLLPLSQLVHLDILILSNTHYTSTCIAILAMNNHSEIPSHLTDELWLMSIDHVSALDWKQLRRTCRRLKELTTPLLFQRVYFELCERGCESLHNISCNRSLSACFTLWCSREFVAIGYSSTLINTWAASTNQPGDPGNELTFPKDRGHYDDKQISYRLLFQLILAHYLLKLISCIILDERKIKNKQSSCSPYYVIRATLVFAFLCYFRGCCHL
jgi:hypothetical protein